MKAVVFLLMEVSKVANSCILDMLYCNPISSGYKAPTEYAYVNCEILLLPP